METHRPGIKELFDEQFERWQVVLPEQAVVTRKRGSIRRAGWTINYRFGRQDGRVFLEYFASHRMTIDTLSRIYDDGTSELVGYCQEFYRFGDAQAEEDYLKHNRAFYRLVEASGLLDASQDG